MNAVNLIPADRRKQRFASSTSPLTLGLVGGLVLILLAAVLYVSAVNDVRSKRAQLAHVTSAAAAWNAAAARFDASVQEMQSRNQKLTAVRQLIDGRFPWSQLLSQLGSVMPANAALTTMSASTSSASAAGTPGTASTAATATTSSGTPTSSTDPTVQLSGCAASQTAVAGTMVALHRIAGVSQVTLTSTASGATAASTGTGACPFSVVFQISLTFTAPSTASSPAISAPSTPATTAPTSTAAASAATPTTTPAAQ